MAVQSWHNKPRPVPNTNGPDIARTGGITKPHVGRAPIPHPDMLESISPSRYGVLGAPPTGQPPDASSPNVTDPSRQGKIFKVPAATHGHGTSNDAHMRGHYDSSLAEHVMNQARCDPADFARKLHTELPAEVTED